jgi:hypothetical protein
MPAKVFAALVSLLVLLRQVHAQEVIIAREERPHFPRVEVVPPPQPTTGVEVNTTVGPKLKAQPPEKKTALSESAIGDVPRPEGAPPVSAKGDASTSRAIVNSSPKPTVPITKPSKVAAHVSTNSGPPLKSGINQDQARTTTNIPRPKRLTLVAGPTNENHSLTAVMVPGAEKNFETAFVKLADGFDFPIGKPDAQGYYKARGFRSHGHLGEDWDGIRGGDTDLGDPIYSIGNGVVVFARDCHMGWGNVVIVRHSYRENGGVKTIDALYGHLSKILIHRGQAVTRGQQIATMGTAHGLYDAHLHLEVRKNIEIGMSSKAFAQDSSNYHDPTQFILTHRRLSSSGRSYRVAMNTFVRDRRIDFDKARNYSHSRARRGTSESAAALKKALASKP